MSIPIIGEQPPPTYPQTQVNVTPQGLVISIQFAPMLALTHVISRDDMTNIIRMWKEVLAQEQMALATIKHVKETKL